MEFRLCAEHCLGALERQTYDATLRLLTQFVTSLGKDRAQSCNTFVVFIGEDDGRSNPTWEIRLLVDALYNPTVQFFIDVARDKGSADGTNISYPLHAALKAGPP